MYFSDDQSISLIMCIFKQGNQFSFKPVFESQKIKQFLLYIDPLCFPPLDLPRSTHYFSLYYGVARRRSRQTAGKSYLKRWEKTVKRQKGNEERSECQNEYRICACQWKQRWTEDQGEQCWAHQEKQGRKPKPENNKMKKEQWQICAVLSKK